MQVLFTLLLLLGQQVQPYNTPPSTSPFAPLPVKGSIEYQNGHRIVNLWGSHYEMGFAHGYLLGDEIMIGFEKVVLNLWTTPGKYQTLWLPAAQNDFYLPPEYGQELLGIFLGMKKAGTDLYVEDLSRNLMLDDLFATNLALDLYTISCSASMGWGNATAADPELQGGSAIVRNWENSPDPLGTTQFLLSIFVYQSSSPDEKGFVSVHGPGSIVISSGFNVDGVGATINGGNHYVPGPPPPEGFYGTGFAVRDGLEDRDYDGDGYETHLDIYEAVRIRTLMPSHLISLFSPYPVPGHPNLGAAAVLEINSVGYALRDASHNMDHVPYLNSLELLCLTNHHRLLYPPIFCARYQNQVNNLKIDYEVDTDELWDIQAGIANSYPSLFTFTMTAFRPNLLDMYVAFSDNPGRGAHQCQRNYYRLADLFPNH